MKMAQPEPQRSAGEMELTHSIHLTKRTAENERGLVFARGEKSHAHIAHSEMMQASRRSFVRYTLGVSCGGLPSARNRSKEPLSILQLPPTLKPGRTPR